MFYRMFIVREEREIQPETNGSQFIFKCEGDSTESGNFSSLSLVDEAPTKTRFIAVPVQLGKFKY